MKGIILAGGSGSRLYPITKGVSKQLLPVYDKPMIYYPLSVLMLAGLQEILIITAPKYLANFQSLLGDGSNFGIQLSYAEQPRPDGLVQAFLIGEEFIGNDNVCLLLGDNIFYGDRLATKLIRSADLTSGAIIFGCKVKDPDRFGVIEFDSNKRVIYVSEKPLQPQSNWAVTGLYFYDNDVVDIAKQIKPSERGELEITAINQTYLERGDLSVELLGRGYTWLDAGTFDSLLDANRFIEKTERYSGYKVGCLEEIGFNKGWITKQKLIEQGNSLIHNNYGQYLLKLALNQHDIGD